MASHDQQLRNPRYRDWVKAGLALKYLKDGIEDFVNNETKEQQKNILEEVQKELGRPEATCKSCPIDQLLAHKRGRYKKGNFCPYDVCDKFFDKIVEQHMYGRPSWSNSDSTKWCTDHWEIAKCFIDGGGYGDKGSVSDTDCKGLLSVITNSMFVQRNVDTPIDRFEPKTDVFSKSKEARNKILHLASLQLPVETLNGYIDVMIQILEDKGRLHEYENAKQAISKLRQLKETDLNISTENEWEIREAALKAVQERKQDALDAIEKKQDEILEKLKIDKIQETLDDLSKTSKETSQSFSNRHESLEQRQTVLESTLKQTQKLQKETSQAVVQLQQDVANLKKDLSDLKARFGTFDEVELRHKKRVTYLEHKKVVRHELFNMYSKYLSNIPISPLLQKLDASVDEFYMELEICNDDVYEKRSNEKTKTDYSEIVENYRDIFYREGERVENIYVLGDAGVGKTTWCLKLIDTWLQGRTDPETEFVHSLSLNKKMMLEFDVVLFISLKHAPKDVNITDMIRNQIFHQTPQLFEYINEILNMEPKTCLVIADGLDEWTAPDDQIVSSLGNYSSFPSRKNINHCTVLTTTRPWKLNEAQPSYAEIDRAVIIRGFSGRSNYVHDFAEKVVNKLNKKVSCGLGSSVGKERKVANFQQELDRTQFYGVTQIPLILIFMIVKWFNDGSLESTMAGNYSFMLKSLLEHEEGYRNIKPKYGRKQKLDGRLSCVSYIEEAKLEWSTYAEKLPECVRKHAVCCQYSRLILKLSEIAFEGLFEKNDKTLIFSEETLLEKLTSEEVEVAVKSGLLSKSNVVVHCNVSKLSFLHKTVQEFMAAIHLVAHHENETCNSFQIFEKYCSKRDRIDEMENVVLFICGLDANLTMKILNHVAEVDNQETNFVQTRFVSILDFDFKYPVWYAINSFLNFEVKCIKELRKVTSVAMMPMVPLNSFITKDMKRFDEFLDMLETGFDKGSIKQVGVKMKRNQGLGPNRLLDILSSKTSPLSNLTKLTLEHISGKCLCTRTNNIVVFNLHNLRNVQLLHINDNNMLRFDLDFSHSRDIENVHLDSLLSCHVFFNGLNLRRLNIKNLDDSYVTINGDLARLAAKRKQTIFGNDCDLSVLQCSYFESVLLKIRISYLGDCYQSYGISVEDIFLNGHINPNMIMESMILSTKDFAPEIHWKEVKAVVLKGVTNWWSNLYTGFFYGICTSYNITSLQCIECDHYVTLETLELVNCLTHLNFLEIVENTTPTYDRILFKDNFLALNGSCFRIVENILDRNVHVIQKFSPIETLELSKVSTLLKNYNVLIKSLVNLKCIKCNGLTEGDFIMYGKCFQYLPNLEDLKLSNFKWVKIENPFAFSCLKKIDKLKKLSLSEFSPEVMIACLLCLPNLSLSEIVLESCCQGITQCLNNMQTLKKLSFTRSNHAEKFLDFIGLIKNVKQIESLEILQPIKDGGISQQDKFVIDKVDLSEFGHLKHVLIEHVHINSNEWQTFVSCLPKNGQLETLEFPKAVIYDKDTKQMIKSTPGFICQKWECACDHVYVYNIILKASEFVIYDRTDFKKKEHLCD